MASRWMALIELLLVFGIVMAWAGWQWWDWRRWRQQQQRREQQRDDER